MLDTRILGRIGIRPEAWEWTPGREILRAKDLYPDMPGYGEYLDPPYEIDGHIVRGGPGWVVMSPADLARFGHLIACQGWWRGERLIGDYWLRNHSGGNGSFVGGESQHYTSLGRVTTTAIPYPLPDDLFLGDVRGR